MLFKKKVVFNAVLSALLVFTMSFGSVSCSKGNNKNDDKDKYNYYPIKENVKMDGQYAEKAGIVFPSSLWVTPQSERYESYDTNDVKAYFIDSINGTKVFCYVGIPESATAENKVPAVVLVHGATGSAFYDWVEMWNKKGYAAIAMDTEGRMPSQYNSTMNPAVIDSVREHGPLNVAFGDSEKTVENQWVYNALASIIASTSFISSFEEVDETKIGITGVSYGSFLTCLAACYDDRYSFAAPVYGSISNAASDKDFATYLLNGKGKAIDLWDDVGVLTGNRTPFLFVSNIKDQFFGGDAITRCAEACEYANIIFKQGLTHGHYQGAAINEIFAFADEIFGKSAPLLRISGNPTEGCVEVEVPDGVTIDSAEYVYTFESKMTSQTVWSVDDADVSGSVITYLANSDAKYSFVRVKDSRGFYACSVVK